MSEIKSFQKPFKSCHIHSVAADTGGSRVMDVGQDELTTAEANEPKTFSHTMRIPNLFREEPGRLMGCQAFREGTDQRGLAHSRKSGDENVGCIAGAIQRASSHC